jgi:hypothetical protein
MKYIFSKHLKAALLSTLSFILLYFIYSIFIDSRMEFALYTIMVEFLFLYPMYLLIGNPITFLIHRLIKQIKSTMVYYAVLILSVSIAAFLIMYLFALNNQAVTGIPVNHQPGGVILLTLLVAISSILGVKVSAAGGGSEGQVR